MKDKISVIVPLYNIKEYLKRCLDSILKQTYRNFEIIMVDDCSTDTSGIIAKDYASRYPEVCRFMQHNENKKVSAARNTGLTVATGNWLSFVDSDDWITDDYLSTMLETALNDNADIVACSYYHIWDGGYKTEINPFGKLTTDSSQNDKVALMRNHAVTRLYRRRFLEESDLLFPEDVWRAEEMGFTIPLLTKTDRVSIIKKPMYYYYQRPTSISNENIKNLDLSFYAKAFEVLEKNCSVDFEKEIEYRAVMEFVYGLTLIMIKTGRDNTSIRQHITEFNKRYPQWRQNKYLQHAQIGKRIFIGIAGKKLCNLLRCLVWAYEKREAVKVKKGIR